MYKRILVAIDDSAASDRAIREAVNLARNQQAMLRIVYVIEEAINSHTEPELINSNGLVTVWAKSGNDLLDKAKLAAQAAGITAETRLIEITEPGMGITGEIMADANAWSADLIVAGVHEHSALMHWLQGSVAKELLRNCRLPILLVHDK